MSILLPSTWYSRCLGVHSPPPPLRGTPRHTPPALRATSPILGEELGYSVRKAFAETSASETFLVFIFETRHALSLHTQAREMNPAPVGRCPSLSATRPLALDVPTQPSGCRDKVCLVSVHRKQNATWRKAIFIYVTLTYNSIYICKCHLFPVTLLMQSNKRSAFPHKSRPPALIIPPPFLFFVSKGCDPFA